MLPVNVPTVISPLQGESFEFHVLNISSEVSFILFQAQAQYSNLTGIFHSIVLYDCSTTITLKFIVQLEAKQPFFHWFSVID